MLKRNTYKPLPRGWTKYIDEVCKLPKPAYGLVESGSLWKLCIEELITTYGFETISGLPQLFIHHQASQQRKVSLLVAKVLDDILFAGTPKKHRRFFVAIPNSFRDGRYISGRPFVFNRVLLIPTSYHSTIISMPEFMETIEFFPLTRKGESSTKRSSRRRSSLVYKAWPEHSTSWYMASSLKHA